MKRSLPRRNESLTDSDEQSDATLQTNLMEPGPPQRPAKRLKVDGLPIPEPLSHEDAGDFSDDPLGSESVRHLTTICIGFWAGV